MGHRKHFTSSEFMARPSGLSSCLRRWLPCLIAALACILIVAPIRADEPGLGFGQFKHTRWTEDEGATTGNWDIAQTPDGWIWLAARDGLWRFDGVTFEHIDVPAGSPMEHANATKLLVTRSGELWVGFAQTAGIAVYRNGHLQSVPMPRTPFEIAGLIEAADGAIWMKPAGAVQTDRLLRFFNGRWEEVAALRNLPNGFITGPCDTADGTLWFILKTKGRDGSLFSLSPDGRRLQRYPLKILPTANCTTDDPKNELWITDGSGMRRIAGSDGKFITNPLLMKKIDIKDGSLAKFDKSYDVWNRMYPNGVFYFKKSENYHNIYKFSTADGLTSETTTVVRQDIIGDIWVTTEMGLDRFQRSSISREPIAISTPGNSRFLAQSDGRIYVGSNLGVFQIVAASPTRVFREKPQGLCAARDGGFWAIEATRIVHFHDGRQSPIPLPQGFDIAGTCAEDRAHRLWIATLDGSLIYYDGTAWIPPNPALPKMGLYELVPTAGGDIAYTTKSDLVRLVGNEALVTRLGRYHLGMITLLHSNGEEFLVSAEKAMLRIRQNRIARIDGKRAPWAIRLKDMAEAPGDQTWMLRNQFISKVRTTDLERAFDEPDAPLGRTFYDQRDGLDNAQGFTATGRQMAVGRDGKAWFLTISGVAFIDTTALRAKTPPVAAVSSLSSGAALYRDPANLTLPAGTRGIEIGYTALLTADPMHAQFRYRLVGLDDDWVYAARRRIASYANLAPGHYRFEVNASTDQTGWSEKTAALDFDILPTFFESWPFKLFCALLALFVLWLLFSLRLRIVAGRIRMLMSERLEERERIARELHDTLLQGFQGLVLRLQAVANQIPNREPVRTQLDDALDRAEVVLAEGRDRVRDLRVETSDLPQALIDTADEMAATWPAAFSLTVVGTPRPLHPTAAVEVRYIGEEAIRNAFRHARARSIDAVLAYRASELCLELRDDGIGLPGDIVTRGRREGHFGLLGMRERAIRIGGKVTISGRTQGGTQVVLSVPGSSAYPAKRGEWWRRLFAWWGGSR